jgi:uncharacterized protein YndB with AHSA1/START domain
VWPRAWRERRKNRAGFSGVPNTRYKGNKKVAYGRALRYYATKRLHMNSAIQDSIEKEIVVRASKERVYAALTTPEQFVKWFAIGVEGTFGAGERPILDFGEFGKFKIYVVAANPYDYFAYRCVPGSIYCPQGFLGDALAEPNTLVEFTLETVAGGTKVHLRESGIASLPAEVIEETLKGNDDGWTFMIGRLEEYLNQE